MKKENSHVLDTKEQIVNTLQTLSDIGITRITKNINIKTDKDITTLSWENHVRSRFNCEKYFTSLEQYIHIYETGAYHAIISDGSIIRLYYKFKKNILIQESLLYWPSPLSIAEDIVDSIGIRQAFEEALIENHPEMQIKMRSPLRIDFDPVNASENHPQTHLHIQHSECRLSLKTPICFNKFIKFIFSNFYPHLDISVLSRMRYINYSGYAANKESIIII